MEDQEHSSCFEPVTTTFERI